MTDVAGAAQELAERTLDAVRGTEITTSADAFVAWGRVLREARARVEAERDAITKPLRALATQHTKRWKPALDAYDAAYALIREKITQFELGRAAQAQALLGPSTTAEELPRVVALAAPRAEGAVITTRWTAEVTDLREFLRWVLEQPDPERWVSAAMPELNAYAREHHAAPPGCRAVETKGTTIR